MSLAYRQGESDEGVVESLLRQVYKTLRRSFLLSFATFGLLLTVFGAAVDPMGHAALAGILGASGIIVFTVNILAYLVYSLLEKRYQ